jgi:hypothetical protein
MNIIKHIKNKLNLKVMNEKEITIKAPDGYVIDNEKSTASSIVFKLNEIFDYKTIRSFEDACKRLNINPNHIWNLSDTKDEVAYKKLKIIFKAINNGWIPDFTDKQYKYCPYFKVSASSLVYYYNDYFVNYFNANYGCRLCANTSDKAEYIGKTFIKEYNDYLL